MSFNAYLCPFPIEKRKNLKDQDLQAVFVIERFFGADFLPPLAAFFRYPANHWIV